MGKPTGFIEWPREAAPKRDKAERLNDSREFTRPFSPEQANHQAARCMDCGVPTCHQGCPLGNVIPDFNDHVFHGRWRAAYATLARTNNFPEFTGRLCPAPCEAACVLGIDGAPVVIEQLEKEIIERAFGEGWVTAQAPFASTGKRVAVVGSGPAGLAAAAQLNLAGHQVTVFEKADAVGGLLRYGIPDFKMEKSVIDRRLALLEAEGVSFRTGVDVGGAGPNAVSWRALRDGHDAVLVAVGSRRPRELTVPGHDSPGVVQAMTYLEAANRGDLAHSARGRRVVILGGGDTGSDCLGTALRQHAASVTQVELLPAPPVTRAPNNPWPEWPLVFRTSSSQEEGGTRAFGLMTTRLEATNGRLTALHAQPVDARLQPLPGSAEVKIDCDLLLLAMGFVGPEAKGLVDELGVTLDSRGNIKVDQHFASSVPKVFAAGDSMRGASLIVWAIADGRDAASAIDAFLARPEAS